NARRQGRHLALRDQLGIPRDAFLYLFSGKLLPRKRPCDLLGASMEIFRHSAATKAHVLYVGDGPLRSQLENMAQPHRERAHSAVFINQSQLPAYYSASDCLVLPSDASETWGLVVSEAAACGIPSIVSGAVGCSPDLIEEGTGVTYPTGNLGELAQAMGKLSQ